MFSETYLKASTDLEGTHRTREPEHLSSNLSSVTSGHCDNLRQVRKFLFTSIPHMQNEINNNALHHRVYVKIK